METMNTILICLLLFIPMGVISAEKTEIAIMPSGYQFKNNDIIEASENLYTVIKNEKTQDATLFVHVCAEPVLIAEAYIVLNRLKYSSVHMVAIGELTDDGC